MHSFMPYMFPPPGMPMFSYPTMPPVMGQQQPGTGQMGDNINSLIYNLTHLNNQLSLTITHVKLLAHYNKLKRSLLGGHEQLPHSSGPDQAEVAKPPELKRQRTAKTPETAEHPLPEQLVPFSMESEVAAGHPYEVGVERVIDARGPGKVEAVIRDDENDCFRMVWGRDLGVKPTELTAHGTQQEPSAAGSDGERECSFQLKRRDMYQENNEQNDIGVERYRSLKKFSGLFGLDAPDDADSRTLENLLQSKISTCQKSLPLSSP